MMNFIIMNKFNFLIIMLFFLNNFINIISSNNKNINPMILGMLLLMMSILNALNLSIFFFNHWYSYLMFLIIVGGLLILFMYFTSFIMNMKMMIKWNFFFMLPLKLLLFLLFMINLLYNLNYSNFLIFFNMFNENLNIFNNIKFINSSNLMSMLYIYSYPINFIMIFLMIYLFFSLTTIVKITMFKKKSIRKISN